MKEMLICWSVDFISLQLGCVMDLWWSCGWVGSGLGLRDGILQC